MLHETRKRNKAKSGTAVLLSAPGITLQKWKNKEIGKTLPYAKTTILRTADEALQMLEKVRKGYRPAPGELEITIIGIDKAKRDAEPFYAGVWKRVSGQKQYGWHCPDCGRQLMKKEEGEWFPLDWSDVAYGSAPSLELLAEAREEKRINPNGLPVDYKVKWKRTKQHFKCLYIPAPKGCLKDEKESSIDGLSREEKVRVLAEGRKNPVCGSKLYRPAVKSRGETRNRPVTNISKVFKKMKKYFHLFICDEAHQCKAGGSGRGDAYDKMVKSAKKNLNLTGTLVNGKASSMKELLWRTTPQDLIDKGFSDSTGDLLWAEKYGKLKQVVYLQDEVSSQGWVTKQRRKPMQPTEEPGIAPQMTAQFLLHKTAFLDIDDLGLPLVELVEKPVFIQPKPEHEYAYRSFHESMYDKCSRLARAGAKGAWSKFTPAVLNYAARPDLGAFYSFVSSDGMEEVISAPKLEGYTAKEEWMINQVKEELAENRGVVIYNTYTGEYQLNERTQQILKENGIESRILNESNTEKRSEVLQQYEDDGVKVIVTNMKLVEVGLDLLAWPTLIFNQLSYEVNVVRQAAKRSHRIGQHRLCKVLVPILNGTQEVAQFKKVMSARGHALMTEGRLDRGELAKYSYDEQSSLATDLAQCFAEADLANAWEELASKEVEGIELVAESDFQQVLEQRMKLLAAETLRLCGISTQDIIDVEAEAEAVEHQEDSLFAFSFSEESEEQLDSEDGFIGVVDMSMYKKKRSKKAPTEDQLVFNF
ncbi:helicase-related protein [Sutcliffiella cohnii]